MEFVNVQKQPPKDLSTGLNIFPSVLKHTPNLLFSLEYAYDKVFSTTSIDDFSSNVLKIKSTYAHLKPSIWIDSGGYAFIKKRFSISQHKDMIKSYCYFLENHSDNFEYIFSLDFPKVIGDDSVDKDDALIKEVNRESLTASIKIISQKQKQKQKQKPQLIDKFYFVYQFLHGNQYEIWRELYKSMGLDKRIKNRAIGGMVGIRANKPSTSSPFIAMAYRCLVDFMKSKHRKRGGEFKLHFLGVYLIQDRFAISFLEKLISTYLPKNKIKFTYDSSAYSKQSMLGHLTLPAFVPFGNNDYQYVGTFDTINIGTELDLSKLEDIESQKTLQLIYDESNIEMAREVMEMSDEKRDSKLLKDISKKIDDEKTGKKTNNQATGNIAIFQPFNALSNKCQDEIISKCIERLNLVNTFRSLKTRVQAISFANDAVVGISHINKSRQDIESDLKSINENIIFSNLHLLWTIRRNLILTYDLHEWFVNRRNDESFLDAKIKDTIDEFSNPKSKK